MFERLTLTNEGFIDNKTGLPCEGLILCAVSAPKNLFFPVLPYTIRGKMHFFLCRTCAEEGKRDYCRHEESERIFYSCYTFNEIAFAIQQSYTIVNVFEILIFDKSEYIFKQYYEKLNKMKIFSEKPPEGKDINEYCNMLNRQMPFLNITPDLIKPNYPLRVFSKFLMNSQLGKMSQNPIKKKIVYISHWKELAFLANNSEYQIYSINPIHEKKSEVVLAARGEYLPPQKNAQVVIYSILTSACRVDMMKDCLNFQKEGARVFYTG